MKGNLNKLSNIHPPIYNDTIAGGVPTDSDLVIALFMHYCEMKDSGFGFWSPSR